MDHRELHQPEGERYDFGDLRRELGLDGA